ncbi:Uncharacterised protein [Peptoniphilus harei]|uniref:Uncharacterized protein n=1 Tax=Peptoniphilus harei TaxID=54005 RepID=A0A2X1YG45_9FIRM|nr:Uncharacterised protein [Peptoniphilus harei]
MRGLLVFSLSPLPSKRITPAYAGTTPRLLQSFQKIQDHPCICGDYEYSKKESKEELGSPLHMRGLHKQDILMSVSIRITPAYAGTTTNSSFKFCHCQDHPCICGDYLYKCAQNFLIPGSPLHMRGLPILLMGSYINQRITPAYAGTTDTIPQPSLFIWDHPCICGDYLSCKASTVFELRITPAYAGTTLKRSRNYLISIIKYPIIYSLYELIFLPELHLQELCEELFHQCHRILKQFLACSYSKISYLFLQTA